MNIYFQLAVIVAVFAAGVYTEHEFHLASQTVEAFRELGVAQKGEVALIKDTQTANKDIKDDKADPCLNTPMPGNLDKLLH